MQNITSGQYIQVATKTSRHQLHNVWLKVKSAKNGSATITCMHNGMEWRIGRSLVKAVSDNPVAGGKLTEVPAPAVVNAVPKTSGVPNDQLVDAIKSLTDVVCKMHREIAELKSMVGYLTATSGVSAPKPFSAN